VVKGCHWETLDDGSGGVVKNWKKEGLRPRGGTRPGVCGYVGTEEGRTTDGGPVNCVYSNKRLGQRKTRQAHKFCSHFFSLLESDGSKTIRLYVLWVDTTTGCFILVYYW
jgi:hypothetical protein